MILLFKNIIGYLRAIPVALNGLALSIITLSNFYSLLGFYKTSVFLFVLACIFICIKIGKYFIHHDVLVEELHDYLQGGYLPLFSMFLATFAHRISKTIPDIALVVWFVAFALHLFLLIYLLFYHCRAGGIRRVLPSWFIPPIGFIAIGLGAFDSSSLLIAKYIFVFAYVVFVPVSLVIIWRQFKFPLNVKEIPSMGIYAAPVSLLILANLHNAVGFPHCLLLLICLNGLYNFISIVALIYAVFKIPFNPSFASFTFPFAISAIAYYQLRSYSFMFLGVGWVLAIISTCMTFLVLLYIVVMLRANR